MKKIRLSRIYYLNWKGLVLSADNPSVDATEENLEKLKDFIKEGKVKVVDVEENEKIQKENPPHIDPPLINLPELKDNSIQTSVERIELYTEEQLKELSRAEVIEIATKNGIEFKKNVGTAKLIEMIIEKQ